MAKQLEGKTHELYTTVNENATESSFSTSTCTTSSHVDRKLSIEQYVTFVGMGITSNQYGNLGPKNVEGPLNMLKYETNNLLIIL